MEVRVAIFAARVPDSFLFGIACPTLVLGSSRKPRMSYDHLYKPQPCSAWPATQLRAVGITYREAAGQGLDAAACLERAVAAYVAAGGPQQGSARTVLDMVASLVQGGRRLALGANPGFARPTGARRAATRLVRGAGQGPSSQFVHHDIGTTFGSAE